MMYLSTVFTHKPVGTRWDGMENVTEGERNKIVAQSQLQWNCHESN